MLKRIDWKESEIKREVSIKKKKNTMPSMQKFQT